MLEELRTSDRTDKTSLILTLLVAIISSFFLSFDGMVILCLTLYISLRWLQRPWTQYDDKSIPIFERHKYVKTKHNDR